MANLNVRIKDKQGNILSPTTKASLVMNNNSEDLGGVQANAEVNVIEQIKVNGVTQTVTNKVVDISLGTGTESTGEASDNIFVPADTTIYVATTGNDTTGDGTSSLPFATLQKALDYLNGKTLLGTVTIQLADGTYTSTSTINLLHPQSNQIKIQGNTSDKTKVILQFNGVTGFLVNRTMFLDLSYMTIQGNSTSGTYGISSAGGYTNCSYCTVKSFNTGFTNGSCGRGNLSNVLFTTNTGGGFGSSEGGYIYATNVQSTYNGGDGCYCFTHGYVFLAASCTLTNNTGRGIRCGANGWIDAFQSTNTVSSNTGGVCVADGNSFVNLISASISGTLSPAANTFGNLNSYIYR